MRLVTKKCRHREPTLPHSFDLKAWTGAESTRAAHLGCAATAVGHLDMLVV
jgi:hypothetical protein